jgi:AraC family transcriptional regulator
MVGETVMEHVRRLRLERAAYRLKFTDEQVVSLALQAGYETHESFTRAFRAMFGRSPSEFRREHRSVAYPPARSRVHFSVDGDVGAFEPVREEEKAMQVRIERFDPVRAAYVRHVGPYNECGAAWGRLMMWAGMRGLLGPNMRHFGMCYDDPDVTPADKIRYDACLVVGPSVRPEGDIGVQEVAGGEFAVAVHRGPYRRLGETYRALCGQWIPASGRQLGPPPSIERYLNDPRSTPEDQLVTEVCIRLA